MKLKDSIHGEFDITEPVILELIKSLPLQRLKGVDQFGYKLFCPRRNIITRFDHSVGVYLLLYKYKAPIEEQIAGLIHDVSHSCFSHCIDYVLKQGSEKKQNLQDNVFDEFVKNSEVKEIIEKYGFDINYILNNDNFPLQEKKIPAVCADRFDYSVRDAYSFRELNKQDIDYILKNLIVENQNWIFRNLESAKKYANLFSTMNIGYWAGLPFAIMFRTVGDFLKHSLEKNYITEEDLYTTDSFVLQRIKRFIGRDEKLALLWKRMNNKTKIINNPNDYDVQVFCKSRIVDPLFKNKEGEIKRRSDTDQGWKNKIKQELQPKACFLKFLD